MKKGNTAFSLNVSKSAIPPLIKYKIVFLGDQSVGKSSIINRSVLDIFDPKDNRPTIGIDFISHNIHLQQKVIRLQLWDTAGQQKFRSLIPNYFRQTAIAIIVFDVKNKASFESCEIWIQDVRKHRGSDVIIFLLANKIDLQQRAVSSEEARSFSVKQDVIYRQVSAKTGQNIQQFFKEMAGMLPESDLKRATSILNVPVDETRPRVEERKETKEKGVKRCNC